ncbi:MAG: alpha/beta hydrolase [Leeuwenhoekiella sp.]|uniref:alpha/beta hydrolase n=1 Tax=Marinobacter sp. NP-4(2019) TaxID=2488665 RepID=UPI000C0F6789|nr:alpha/beta hydrolase [Marinobacter sp. NP-4(2019)]AZT83970.1 alpha/beta hydrolase [Marinobacter sp. NP-4(2019)]PHR89731.1 MAG: alpha/beta hydrolase [Leeuwenhoekiella sp.]
MRNVTFKSLIGEVAANLHLPKDFDESKQYPALVVAHPISSCKEQTAGIYAERLAELGYVALAFDAATQGASGGEPSYLENPGLRVADFSSAVDFLVTQGFIDENRIGVLGICGGGAYAANAAMSERRFKAVATVVAANYGRLVREGDMSPNAAINTLEAVGQQRTAEARGEEPMITGYAPNSKEELETAGITDIDVVQAVDYYRTPRGQHPGSPNKLRFTSIGAAATFDAFHLTEKLLTQPLQIIIGSVPGAFGSYRDGFELYEKAASTEKDLLIVEGASHYDLYDQPEPVKQAVEKLKTFFGKYL